MNAWQWRSESRDWVRRRNGLVVGTAKRMWMVDSNWAVSWFDSKTSSWSKATAQSFLSALQRVDGELLAPSTNYVELYKQHTLQDWEPGYDGAYCLRDARRSLVATLIQDKYGLGVWHLSERATAPDVFQAARLNYVPASELTAAKERISTVLELCGYMLPWDQPVASSPEPEPDPEPDPEPEPVLTFAHEGKAVLEKKTKPTLGDWQWSTAARRWIRCNLESGVHVVFVEELEEPEDEDDEEERSQRLRWRVRWIESGYNVCTTDFYDALVRADTDLQADWVIPTTNYAALRNQYTLRDWEREHARASLRNVRGDVIALLQKLSDGWSVNTRMSLSNEYQIWAGIQKRKHLDEAMVMVDEVVESLGYIEHNVQIDDDLCARWLAEERTGTFKKHLRESAKLPGQKLPGREDMKLPDPASYAWGSVWAGPIFQPTPVPEPTTTLETPMETPNTTDTPTVPSLSEPGSMSAFQLMMLGGEAGLASAALEIAAKRLIMEGHGDPTNPIAVHSAKLVLVLFARQFAVPMMGDKLLAKPFIDKRLDNALIGVSTTASFAAAQGMVSLASGLVDMLKADPMALFASVETEQRKLDAEMASYQERQKVKLHPSESQDGSR